MGSTRRWWRRGPWPLAWAGVLLLPAGCGNDGGSAVGPCDALMPAPACGASCTTVSDCADGFHCVAGQCTADCVAESGRGCPTGERCTNRGRCVHATGVLDGSPGDRRRGDGHVCADLEVGTRRVTPTVMLIVDQSSSMDQRFSSQGDRWNVLRDSLLAQPDGFIWDLQSQVRFGLALYSSANGGGDHTPADRPCPMMTTVDPAIGNYDGIAPVYRNAEPIEDTPTGDAVDAVLDQYLAIPDPPDDPVIFVLATDGEPDRCEQADPNPTDEAQGETIAAIERAYANGIRTFLIDVGNEVGPAHKRDVANAGAGRGPGEPDATYWTVTDDSGLRDALRSIIGGVLSCDVALQGEITDLDRACEGTVRLNGDVLPCNDPNGWRATDPRHIEILGSACDRLLEGQAVLEATFPCEGVVLI